MWRDTVCDMEQYVYVYVYGTVSDMCMCMAQYLYVICGVTLCVKKIKFYCLLCRSSERLKHETDSVCARTCIVQVLYSNGQNNVCQVCLVKHVGKHVWH